MLGRSQLCVAAFFFRDDFFRGTAFFTGLALAGLASAADVSAFVAEASGASEAGASAVDEHELGERDVLIGISASRRTPYVRGALSRGRERGAWTAFLVCNELGEPPEAVADCVVELVVGPEAITGSSAYDEPLRLLLGETPAGDAESLFHRLAVEDIRAAADQLRPVHEATAGVDGMVTDWIKGRRLPSNSNGVAPPEGPMSSVV